jgi:hypothetical protein
MGDETNHVQNGLLLRSDLHPLFDRGLLGVDAATLTLSSTPDCDRASTDSGTARS